MFFQRVLCGELFATLLTLGQAMAAACGQGSRQLRLLPRLAQPGTLPAKLVGNKTS
jgi:hypothetical protein